LIAVLDYGIGNLRSAQKAIQKVSGDGVEVRLATTAAEASGAAGVVLPGVGAFGACMEALRRAGLDAVVKDAVGAGLPFLGICVGMQMLFDGSDEAPDVPGLGVLSGQVRGLPAGVKRPQMQWNRLRVRRPDDPLLAGVSDGDWTYFVHSYAPPHGAHTSATTDYGGDMVAAAWRDNVWATQFHPEKSGRVGLRLLSNFAALAER